MVIHPGRKAKQKNGNINGKILIKCFCKSKTFSDCKVRIKQIWDLKLKLSATKNSTHDIKGNSYGSCELEVQRKSPHNAYFMHFLVCHFCQITQLDTETDKVKCFGLIFHLDTKNKLGEFRSTPNKTSTFPLQQSLSQLLKLHICSWSSPHHHKTSWCNVHQVI